MENKHYLIFSLYGSHYAVNALLVQEIFHLPELTSIAEAPDDIVGILNLRGKIVPVMHLALRLGYQPQECSTSDSVIVLEWQGTQIGIIVSAVYEVKNIAVTAIEAEISYGRKREINSRFIGGVAKVDADMIMLLDHEQLLCYSDTFSALLPDEASDEILEATVHSSKQSGKAPENQFADNYHLAKSRIGSFYELCCPNATPEDRKIFRERAENLRQPTTRSDFSGLMPLAVIGLNGEYFGLDLDAVREFTDIRNVTLIPCCPPHIIGNMNLRGEIVTLVDIRQALNLPNVTDKKSQAMVIRVGDVVAGLPVDAVYDVMYLRPQDVTPIPAAVNSNNNEYLRGTAPYSEKMLSIIDLPKIIAQSELAVNEEV